jgi:hypothetical protein
MSPPSDPAPDLIKRKCPVDTVNKISFLLALSAVLQFCSLFVLYLMADNLSALLKAHLIVHYEKIGKWKYGGNIAPDSTATARGPVAVPPLR